MKEGIDFDFFLMFFLLFSHSIGLGAHGVGRFWGKCIPYSIFCTNNVVLFKVHLDSLKHFHFFGTLFKNICR